MTNSQDVFTIKWILNPSGFANFAQKYRIITKIPFGGTKQLRYTYPDLTQTSVLSVGQIDNIKSLPLRLPLTNLTSTKPITSYGCILRIINNSTFPKYLIIRRNDSLSYVELVHGNYKESQLFFMLKQLTLLEITRLLTHTYEELWEDLNRSKPTGSAYEYGKHKFEILKIFLPTLLEEFPSEDPKGLFMWIFPKGRPNYINTIPECPLDCALREFEEETNGISLNQAKVVLSHPIIERFMGTNSKNYATHYFVYEMSIEPVIKQFERINTAIRSVSIDESDIITFMTIEELKNNIHPGRFELIKYIEQRIEHNDNVYPKDIDSIWKHSMSMDDFVSEN